MKKFRLIKNIFTCLLCFISLYCYSQSDIIYDISQIEGSEPTVIDFLNKNNLTKDYTFTALLPIGGCPRCEGNVSLFLKQASETFSDQNIVLIAVGDKHTLAKKIVSNKDYYTDNIIYVKYNDNFIKSFHFATDRMGVPYLVILNNKTGKLINAISTLGIDYSKDFFKEFTSDLNNVKLQTIKRDTMVNNSEKQTLVLDFSKSFKIDNNKKAFINNIIHSYDSAFIIGSDTTISSALNYTFSNDLKRLAISDFLSQEIYLYEIKDDNQYHLKDVISPTLAEYKVFVDNNIPDELFYYLKNINMLQVFYLDLDFYNNNNHLLITASLPKVFWEDSISENLGYINQGCLMDYNINTKEKTFTKLTDFEKTEGNHQSFFVDELNKQIYFPAKKGWPATGTSAEPKDSADDPANSHFYDNCPVVVQYNIKGNFINNVGHLPEWHKNHQTGYFYFSPIVKFDNNTMYIADKHVGEIMLFDRNNQNFIDNFNIFEIYLNDSAKNNIPIEQKSASTTTRLKQIMDKKPLLPLELIDFIISGDSLIYYLTDGYVNVLGIRSLKTGEDIDQYYLPILKSEGDTSNDNGIMRNVTLNKTKDNKINIVILDDKSEMCKVLTTELKRQPIKLN